MTTITIEISGPAADRLRQLAEAERRSEAEIVRDALESYAPARRKLPTGVGKYRSGQRDIAQNARDILRQDVQEGKTTAMSHEIRKRIVRPATPEEKDRHQRIRQEIEQELPELKQWARTVAAQHKERVGVGTVFTAEEAEVVKAIDDYAAKHALQSRSAVVREALAYLLGIEIPRQ